jgi:hypothetical protein
MTKIRERLDLIIPRIQETGFLEGRRLGNEISFYIFDYSPKDELLVRDYIKLIKREFDKVDSSIKIIEFDLYNLMLDLGKEMDIFEAIFEMEDAEGKDVLYNALEEFCADPSIFMEKIKDESDTHDLIFITGVGKVFPFLRSHTLLNNLMEKIHGKPLIMFYPGEYNELSLKLFGKLDDNNYYRAFRLIDMK